MADRKFIDWPLDPTRTGDEYGWRVLPAPWGRNHHNGLDFTWKGIGGTPVRAVADGTVLEAGWHRELGNFVRMSHGDGISTGYMHFMDSPHVKAGARVTRGQLLGHVGTTGMSTGDHLHWEFWLNGTRINPREGMRRFGTGRIVSPPGQEAGGGAKPLEPNPKPDLNELFGDDDMRIIRDASNGRVYALAPAYCQHVRDTSTANVGVNLYPNPWRNNEARQIELSHADTNRALDLHGVPRTAAGNLKLGEVWTPAGIINK